VYTVDNSTINQFEVPQSNDLSQFLDKKDFKNAYEIACFGVTENDWKNLGIQCIKNGEWD